MGCLLSRLLKVELALQVKDSFVLLMWVHGASFVDVQKTRCHIKEFVQWPNLMLMGLAR
jgi:hypothetical protein